MDLQEIDAAAAANATGPRVTLASMEAKIVKRFDMTGNEAVPAFQVDVSTHVVLSRLSICVLVLKNGFMLVGKSAPASSENFNRELGAKLAYDDAIRQLWPMEGYLLRTQLAAPL